MRMTRRSSFTLLAAVCDFGWGSLGKLRLILDRLPQTDTILHGDAGINRIAADLLGERHRIVAHDTARPDAALVINDPDAAKRISMSGVTVIYVDSLPYLWARPEEVPPPEVVDVYCAQKYARDRIPLSAPLSGRNDIQWVDPIVPATSHRRGGRGVVVNVGGLHSHLAGDAVSAYIDLVLIPLAEELRRSRRIVSAICGNLSEDTCARLAQLLPECQSIGRRSPYEFERLLEGADLLVTAPGSTTILQALSLKLPTLLLPPQNLSQILNAHLFSRPEVRLMSWPESVISRAYVDALRPGGEDGVLGYIYGAISAAARSTQHVLEIRETIQSGLRQAPIDGVLDQSVLELGTRGAIQVAQFVRQAMFAPHPSRRLGESR